MSPEKPHSIVCDTCGGWHPTEAHVQFEPTEREGIMAEINDRPDSAYQFNTLGFGTETKGEIESWMHNVIEKAKTLGDDLQQSDNFLHMEMSWGFEKGRLLKLLNKGFFAPHPLKHHEGRDSEEEQMVRGGFLNVRPHNACTKFERWGLSDLTKEVLIAQERYVHARTEDNLIVYKQLLREAIHWHALRSQEGNTLETTEDRKRAMDALIVGDPNDSETSGYGIILAFPERLKQDPEFVFIDDPATGRMQIRDRASTKSLIGYPDPAHNRFGDVYLLDEPVFDSRTNKWSSVTDTPPTDRIKRLYARRTPETEIGFSRSDLEGVNDETLLRLSQNVLNGLYVSGGVKEQQEMLNKMLNMTKDHPVRRVPIYNFYGKLIWPRPPKQEQSS